MRLLITIVLVLVTGILTLGSFLHLAETDVWWVRTTDFPRLQYGAALLVLLVLLALLARWVSRPVRVVLVVLALVSLGYNVFKLAPYMPIGGRDDVASCDAEDSLTVLVANVQMENRESAGLLELVQAREPDLFLALETDAWWDTELSPLGEAMPQTVSHIDDDFYGMHLFSRLPLSETRVMFPVETDTPSILAKVELPSGNEVQFMGLHPRPPHPGQSSVGRDAALMWAGLRAWNSKVPVVAAGDLNAVPWERSAMRMQRIGQFLDPRRSEGFKASFNSSSWWMIWPLDQVLHQAELSLVSLDILSSFGSDHYPVEATLCDRPSEHRPPSIVDGDMDEAEETIRAVLDMQRESEERDRREASDS
ncbi:endonuclease/exonuclease/phosphatase family protein [Salipiger mucosus]|uniref:Endonuclease/exonuclease/phosphatase domain-containing protein n=1 Tax=Salipiger mucosus DSM 16094 TaxID=1123237 RepID=S9QEQ4_9RHOB|nr:endonuclease/exonuclease/phosphatase family protein [Salipiger mucosus]EPX78397.1 hypothetical protein Salmuc_03505 [Salipiger mucosus DSM 16094]